MVMRALKVGAEEWTVQASDGRPTRLVIRKGARVTVYDLRPGNQCLVRCFDTERQVLVSAEAARLHDFTLDTIDRVLEQGSRQASELEPWIAEMVEAVQLAAPQPGPLDRLLSRS